MDRVKRLTAALTDMDFLKLVSRVIRDPRINTTTLSAILSKGKYPYQGCEVPRSEPLREDSSPSQRQRLT